MDKIGTISKNSEKKKFYIIKAVDRWVNKWWLPMSVLVVSECDWHLLLNLIKHQREMVFFCIFWRILIWKLILLNFDSWIILNRRIPWKKKRILFYPKYPNSGSFCLIHNNHQNKNSTFSWVSSDDSTYFNHFNIFFFTHSSPKAKTYFCFSTLRQQGKKNIYNQQQEVVMSLNRNQIDCDHRSVFLQKQNVEGKSE